MYGFSLLSVASLKSSRNGYFLGIHFLMDLCHLHLALVSIGATVKGGGASQVARLSASADCQSLDSPNQHSQLYPDLITGNLNGTTLIVPISLEIAQEVIPDEYEIAEQAYRELLPSFPDGMYPMVAQIVHDHDIRVYSLNTSLADFSRASLEFPFIYIAGDDHSPFRWVGTSLITYSNDIAIEGAESYGITVHPATFDPPCDAYISKPDGTTYAHSQSNDTSASRFITLETKLSRENVPYPLDFIKNVTNQPVFANPQMCDYYVRLFNTSVTTGETAPVPVIGNVHTNLEPFAAPQMWDGVYGWRLATPFLEPLEPVVCVKT